MLEFNATFLVAMLSFVVFIMIMNAIFYNPILGIMRKREDYINSNYEDSKRYNASADEYKTTHAAKIEQVQERCRHEFRHEIDEARTNSTAKVNAAREKTKATVQDKKDELNVQGNELKNTVKQTVVKDLASIIASKFPGIDGKIDTSDYETVNKVMN